MKDFPERVVRTLSQSQAYSLLPTLAICTCIGLLCSIYGTVAQLYAHIVTMHSESQVSYWMARSEAIALLRRLTTGETVPASFTLACSKGNITVSAAETNMKWTVRVTADVPGSVDTVVFTYDAIHHICTAWQDNALPP